MVMPIKKSGMAKRQKAKSSLLSAIKSLSLKLWYFYSRREREGKYFYYMPYHSGIWHIR
jgi:hypothetical protein